MSKNLNKWLLISNVFMQDSDASVYISKTPKTYANFSVSQFHAHLYDYTLPPRSSLIDALADVLMCRAVFDIELDWGKQTIGFLDHYILGIKGIDVTKQMRVLNVRIQR